MFAKLKKSELYKSVSKKLKVKFVDNKKDIKKREVMDQLSYPDVIWHRSKSARFRQN